MRTLLSKLSMAVAVVATSFSVVAGTLENAPFKISLPSDDWKLADSTAQEVGPGTFWLATITKTNSPLKSMMIKTVMDKSDGSPDEFFAGIRDSLANPAVKTLSDEATTFLGYKARRFTYELTAQNKKTTYNETIVFVAGKTGWAINGTGLVGQESEVHKIFTFYQKRAQ